MIAGGTVSILFESTVITLFHVGVLVRGCSTSSGIHWIFNLQVLGAHSRAMFGDQEGVRVLINWALVLGSMGTSTQLAVHID